MRKYLPKLIKQAKTPSWKWVFYFLRSNWVKNESKYFIKLFVKFFSLILIWHTVVFFVFLYSYFYIPIKFAVNTFPTVIHTIEAVSLY